MLSKRTCLGVTVLIIFLLLSAEITGGELNQRENNGVTFNYSKDLAFSTHRWEVSKYILNGSRVIGLPQSDTDLNLCFRGDMYSKPIGSVCPIIEGSIIEIKILSNLSMAIPTSLWFPESIDTSEDYRSYFNESVDGIELPNLPYTKNLINPTMITFENQTAMNAWEYKKILHGPNTEFSSFEIENNLFMSDNTKYDSEGIMVTQFKNEVNIITGLDIFEQFEIFSWDLLIQINYISGEIEKLEFPNFNYAVVIFICILIVIFVVTKQILRGRSS